MHFGGIVVADRAIHETADGRSFLVIHGDQFDAIVHNVRWLAYLGDRAYDVADHRQPHRQRRAPAVRHALLVVLVLGQGQGQEGGQLHQPLPEDRWPRKRAAARSTASSAAISTTPRSSRWTTSQYINTGDWVESCTAVVEHFDGRMEIIRWTDPLALAAAATERFVPVVVEGNAAAA